MASSAQASPVPNTHTFQSSLGLTLNLTYQILPSHQGTQYTSPVCSSYSQKKVPVAVPAPETGHTAFTSWHFYFCTKGLMGYAYLSRFIKSNLLIQASGG